MAATASRTSRSWWKNVQTDGEMKSFGVADVLGQRVGDVVARDPRVVFGLAQRLADLREGQQKLAERRKGVGLVGRTCRARTLHAVTSRQFAKRLGADGSLEVAVELHLREPPHGRRNFGIGPAIRAFDSRPLPAL